VGKVTSRLSRNKRPGIVCLSCSEARCPESFLMLFAQRVPFSVEQDFRRSMISFILGDLI